MTNDESPNLEIRNGETGPVGLPLMFGFRYSIDIRHSDSSVVARASRPCE